MVGELARLRGRVAELEAQNSSLLRENAALRVAAAGARARGGAGVVGSADGAL